jgi:hypothetical protein
MRALLASRIVFAGSLTGCLVAGWPVGDVVPVDSETATDAPVLPVIASVLLSPSAPTVEDRIVAEAILVEGDDVDVEYAFWVEGAEVQRGADAWLEAPAFAKGDSVVAEARVRVGDVYGPPRRSAAVVVANAPPRVVSLSLEADPDGPARTGSTLHVDAEGWDPDGDEIEVSYVWRVGGRVIEGESSSSLGPAHFSRGDRVEVVVEPSDGEMVGSAGSAFIDIVNTPPVIASVALSPDPVTTVDTLAAEVSVTDADDDALTVTYRWSVGGVLILEGPSHELGPSHFVKGDTVTLQVTASDDIDEVVADVVQTVVANTQPAVVSVALSPAAPQTLDVLTATADAFDPDDDALTWSFVWRVDGEVVPGVAGPELASTFFVKGQIVDVVATVSDAAASHELAASGVQIQNTPPTAPGVVLTPEEPWEGDAITCSVEAEAHDPDAVDGVDTLVYLFSWTVDGNPYDGETADGDLSSTVVGSAVGPIEWWVCEVRAYDGDALGPASQAEVETGGRYVQVSAGGYHSCGLREDGSVRCWGSDEHGCSSPPEMAFLSISAGENYTCGVRTDHDVVCWGFNFYGEGTPLTGWFESVTTGWWHACGLRPSGNAECWGSPHDARNIAPDWTFLSLAAGGAHTCGLREDATAVCWGVSADGRTDPPEGAFSKLASGADQTCGLRASGAVECWGANVHGEGTPPSELFEDVALGHRFSCGLRADGSVGCWGASWSGEAFPPDEVFESIDLGRGHACGIRHDGKVVCWGSNSDGQATPP